MWVGNPSPTPDLPAASGLVRVAGASSRPRLEGSTVSGVATSEGREVFPAAPRLVVPAGDDFGWGRWRLTLTVNDATVSTTLAELQRCDQMVHLGSLLPANRIAEVELDLVGPLGHDLRHARFAVVPGLEVGEIDHVLVPGESVTVPVIVDAGLRLAGSADSCATLTITGEPDTADLVVEDGVIETALQAQGAEARLGAAPGSRTIFSRCSLD